MFPPRRPAEDGSTECWHGPDECHGALIELCTQDTHDAWTTTRYTECVTHEFERIPDRDLYEECAARTLVDLEAVDRCVARDGGAYGRKLLRDSAQHTIDVSKTVLTVSWLASNLLDITQ